MEDEGKELTQLKTLYDELWHDARTMIKDMNKSIYIYLFAARAPKLSSGEERISFVFNVTPNAFW